MTYHSDTELEAGTNEHTPMLRRRERNAIDKKQMSKRKFYRFLEFFAGGIYAPDASTYDPIEIMLNTEYEDERNRLTEIWRDNRLKELSFVGVVAALLAGVLTSTGSWPDILPQGVEKPWYVRTAWYCGIILSLFSILAAADQTVRLHRLSSHGDALKRIRRLLAKRDPKGRHSRHARQLKPNTLQIYAWQLPVIFLTAATIAMIVGMFLHVWAATRFLDPSHWWDPNSKMALTFTIVAFGSIIIFFAGQATLYSNEDLELY